MEWLDITEDYFKKRNATMLIKLGLVKEFEVSAPMMALESVTINIEVTPDEYIFYKPGLFSRNEIVKIQRKDVTEITNESLCDKSDVYKEPQFMKIIFYFLKRNLSSIFFFALVKMIKPYIKNILILILV